MFTKKKQQQIPTVCTKLVHGFIKKYVGKKINIPLVIVFIINIYYYYSFICFEYFNKKNMDKYVDINQESLIAMKKKSRKQNVRVFGKNIIDVNSYLFNSYSKYIQYIWKIETVCDISQIALGICDIKRKYYRLSDPKFVYLIKVVLYMLN